MKTAFREALQESNGELQRGLAECLESVTRRGETQNADSVQDTRMYSPMRVSSLSPGAGAIDKAIFSAGEQVAIVSGGDVGMNIVFILDDNQRVVLPAAGIIFNIPHKQVRLEGTLGGTMVLLHSPLAGVFVGA